MSSILLYVCVLHTHLCGYCSYMCPAYSIYTCPPYSTVSCMCPPYSYNCFLYMCPLYSIYVSSILLYIYVSSILIYVVTVSYICVLHIPYIRVLHTTVSCMCPLYSYNCFIYMCPPYSYMCTHGTIYVSSCYCIFVLILLYVCPHLCGRVSVI